MKKIIYLIFLLNSIAIFSQDIIDPQPLQLIYSYSDSTKFHTQFDGFVRGWNGFLCSPKLGDALTANFYETKGDYDDSTVYPNNVYMIQGLSGFVNSAWGYGTWCAPGFQFEPTIIVDTTQNFKPRYKDNVGSVFGFRTRNFGDTISYDSDPVHFHKLYFDTTKMGSNRDTLALANSWPDYEFKNMNTSTFFGINKLYFKNNACIFNYYFITCNFDFYIL